MANSNFLDEWLSTRRNQPAYTISRTGESHGRPLPRIRTCGEHLGPGHYRIDRSLTTKSDTRGSRGGRRSRKVLPSCEFASTSREQHFLQDVGPNSNLGPGNYHKEAGMADRRVLSQDPTPVVIKMTQAGALMERPLPREPSAAEHLGPGKYYVPSDFEHISARKAHKLERAAAKAPHVCWADRQYALIFNCMKPTTQRRSSLKQQHRPYTS
mmetsp:Transcript_13009/g.23924  ORF Transcript_13009/g.23924 Transcript_13009/m.23924 type:complete len:212 (-) Transcript_13009:171-806(-)